jgi:very-short-patch-repair endonuclease
MLRKLAGRAALSHQSRVLAAGLPVWRADLRAAHVTRVNDEVTRRRPHLVSHSRVPGLRIAAVPQLGPVVPVAIAIVQTGLVAGAMDAAIAADAALHAERVTRDDLRAAVELLAGHRGLRRTAAALDRCDSRHESAGETRLAHVMADLRVAVTPQFEITTRLGKRRADFRIDGTRVLLEFDGRVKYTDPRRAGDVLWQEKQRQDALEDEGWTVVRVTWADLADPAELWRRIRAAIARSRARVRTPEPR